LVRIARDPFDIYRLANATAISAASCALFLTRAMLMLWTAPASPPR
jgi:hypothetical protein